MKYFLSLSFLFLQFSFWAQNGFVIISDVKNDSIQIKWTPKNIQTVYTLWENGASIELNEINSGKTQSFQIEPIKTHLNKFDKVNFEKEIALIEQLLSVKTKTEKEKKFAFALFMIESSVSKKMNQAGALSIQIPNSFSSNITCSISVKGLTLQTETIVTNSITQYPSIETAKISVDQKKIANLEWDASSLEKNYLGFIIERKLADSAYVVITQEPFVYFRTNTEKELKLASYRDESVKQGLNYTYRITALNFFGEKAGVSKELTVYIPVLVNADLNIKSIVAKEKNRILNCEVFIQDKKSSVNLEKLILLRSLKKDSDFSEVPYVRKSLTDSTFELTVVNELESGEAFYYQLLGISKDNDSVKSTVNYFYTLDQTAPLQILNLKGKVDSTGIAKITWEKSTDTDIQGYKVFRSNSMKDEFIECTNSFVKGLNYQDTLNLNSLTNEIYYFVIAVDENFNNSIPSDTIELIKPDTIAPIPAIIEDLILGKNGIEIKWKNAVNTDKTIQYLYKKSDGKLDSLKIEATKENYFDSIVQFGKMNVYYIKTIDLSNNSSVSKEKGLIYEPGFRPALINVKGKLSENKKNIVLTWENTKFEVFQYFIYKKKNDGKFQLVKTIEKNGKNEYLDIDVNISNEYEYIIVYQTKEGFRSLKHNPVKVRI